MNVVARVRVMAGEQLLGRGVQHRARSAHGCGQELAGAGRLAVGLDCACDGDSTDAEVRDPEHDLAALRPLDQDVGRFQVAMHDRRVEPMSESHGFGDLKHGPGNRDGRRLLRLPMPVQDEAAKVTPLDILILQARWISG